MSYFHMPTKRNHVDSEDHRPCRFLRKQIRVRMQIPSVHTMKNYKKQAVLRTLSPGLGFCIAILGVDLSAMALWQAHPHCPPEARNRLGKIIQALPEESLPLEIRSPTALKNLLISEIA
ncbi:hypothetical protein GJ744_008729 [Endocarpon pusillum]|uniref:Uncharacterized protein n=1 Tax=Endocarpon pusillum TaxID=364733 RepID=A0A8H7AQ67_9EURO|nr:hypothetical protein GJ744_008729 [Endocarpon pusillum]